jgi:hypothetical protein
VEVDVVCESLEDQKVSYTFKVSMVAVVFGIAILVIYPFYKSMTASAQIEFCYVVPVQNRDSLYDLYGFRSWRNDRFIAASLHSLEQAKNEADRISCPLK